MVRRSIIACAIIVRFDNDDASGKWVNIAFRRQPVPGSAATLGGAMAHITLVLW